ncbi:excalibur calcium-binding domain-containing protein [Micrococcus luteus]|uniref:excalibur calcium-binding domain-containing protein n=1 Tax=Micrococcus luteus TaxID=1270 RepID=UPI0033EEE415
MPAGLFCRDLKAKGYSYVAATEYWRLHGQPNQMDADRNGIPCETVYPRSDVSAYWNGRQVSGVVPLASGLLCRDLAARGATYAQAVGYWWYYGMPERMDADKNGIPCETVYSAATVYAFWVS